MIKLKIIILIMILTLFLGCIQTADNPVASSILIKTTKTEIIADSVDKVEIKADVLDQNGNVLLDKKVVVKDKNGIEIKEFTTAVAGSYEFTASFNNQLSKTLTISAINILKKITINSNSTEIIADGKSTVTFSYNLLDQNNHTYTTNESIKIYKENELLENNTFSTTTAGVYVFYVKIKNLTSSALTITAYDKNKVPGTVTLTPKSRIANYVTLSWTSDIMSKKYKLYFSNSKGGPYIFVNETTGNNLDYQCVYDKNYYFVVTGIGDGGEGAYSNELNILVQTPAAPSMPASVKTSIVNGYIRLSWNAIYNATGYKIYYVNKTVLGQYYTTYKETVKQEFCDILSASKTNTSTGTYSYGVSAFNSIGESEVYIVSFTLN